MFVFWLLFKSLGRTQLKRCLNFCTDHHGQNGNEETHKF